MAKQSKIKPSKEQQAILNAKGNVMVISNPGTGKTTTLALKVLNLLKNGVEPEEILCITFTAKAKKEMFDSIYDLAQGQIEDSVIMKIPIHTFHSFAYDYLTGAGLIPENIAGNNLLRYSILESLDSNKALNYTKSHVIGRLLGKIENSMRYIKNFGLLPSNIDSKKTEKILTQIWQPTSTFSVKDLQYFLKYYIDAYKHYENSKNDVIDYADMLLTFVTKFQDKKFKHVLVDEMQDMNEIEAKLVTMVAENLFLVGDAKQAIFGFQGGSIKNFQTFTKICKPLLLSENRRSTQEILDYSKKYFLDRTSQVKQYQNELKNFKSSDSGSIPQIISTNAKMKKILAIINKNPKKDIGIITRTNYQIIEISKYLDANSIDYTSTASQSVTNIAKDEIKNYIRGRLSKNVKDIVGATLTSFSPFSLREAFEFSNAIKRDGTLKNTPNISKLLSWKIDLSREKIDELFSDEILPICIAKGEEWFFTAKAVKEQIEEYLSLETPTLEGLFDFIDIAEEEYTDRVKESKVTLTTVHKAKGRAFDIVIYLPASTSGANSTSWIDAITTSITKSAGIDLQDEVIEESIRIDFVALTRAKKELFIVGEESISKQFFIPKLSKFKDESANQKGMKEDSVATLVDSRLSDAYEMFVHGRFKEAQTILTSKEPWLKNLIFSYFNNIERLSYSSITKDPYKFLIKNIIKKPYVSAATDYGNEVHSALQKIVQKQAKLEDFPKDQQKSIKNGLDALKELEKKFPGLKLVSSEKYEKIPLKSITTYTQKDNLLFGGFLDLVYEHDDGFLIIDWKTDKDDSKASVHKRQLAVYKKMYSKLYNKPPEEITTCVIFVALRGSVNVGKFEKKIEYGTRDSVFATFEGHLQHVLEWKKDPNKFIKELLEQPDEELLHKIVKEKLKNQMKKK